ncbi:45335_t:CDS:2 [Gigaspora margarita]|uniref:45335_t:CDS:1 n=1 Tax=Gigaspora margarita TaxID=4874 RepID=A0ABN7UPH5_GIGMA|nr:45335_t:CDS:2 [Gigaspora margarita]
MSYLHGLDTYFKHSDPYQKVKISDFGLSKNINSTMTASADRRLYGEILFIDSRKLENQSHPFNKKSDVYSMSMIMWEISNNGTPKEYVDLYSP